jgi:hypothetical protein
MFIRFRGYLKEGFGWNLFVSTAFGIVKQVYGLILALKVKLSLQAWDTQIEASTSLRYHLHILFIYMHPRSL